ncbi:RNaseH domain-containing protein [Embleya sp. NBC_00888]|uniref:RNaseH domain-containing protein n=1 Tax=Embleya sp. NBC_00888 TaxID=2975960 RepID=UPI0038709334|nr:RNaseH domain-containing protein [Embleya sp. NBC_00888]
MLRTRGFLLSPDALGHVCIYRLTDLFEHAWTQLPGYSDGSTGRPTRPRYAALATALSAVTGQPVVLMPDDLDADPQHPAPLVLVTTRPISPSVLIAAVRAWERHIRGDVTTDTLSRAFAGIVPETQPLAAFIQGAAAGTPRAPRWFFRVAAWHCADVLSRTPLVIPGHGAIDWRLDTDGNLVAWDEKDIVTRTLYNGRTVGRCMHRVELRVVAMPGESRLAVHVIPVFSRLADHWAGRKSAYIARGKGVVLRLPVGNRRVTRDGETLWEPFARNAAAEVVEACGVEIIDLGDNDDLKHLRGPVRSLTAASDRHPLGRGPGALFTKYLTLQFADCLAGVIEQIAYEDTGRRFQRAVTGRVPAQNLDDAIVGTGKQNVVIHVLQDSAGTRRRMAAEIAALAGIDDSGQFLPQDTQSYPLTQRLSVVFRHTAALDAPEKVDWDTELRDLPSTDATTLHVALVETHWHANPATRRRPAQDSPSRHDHKDDLKRWLYGHRVIPQFLATRSTPDDDTHAPTDEPVRDHPAEGAVRKLLVRAGLVDTRLSEAASPEQDLLLVGIHVRQQHVSHRNPRGATRTRMIEILTSIELNRDATSPAQVRMYDASTHQWRPVADAMSAYASGPIGHADHARHREGARLVRDSVESALRLLPRDRPICVWVEAEATRTIWPGLQYSTLGDGALPGDSLRRDGCPLAVVCVNITDEETPQPVDRDGWRKYPERPLPPKDTLYRRTSDTGREHWYIGQASRQYTGGPIGRASGEYTRFTVPEEHRHRLGKDWHDFTGTLIDVAQQGPWAAEDLALLTAQLCHQSLAWDGRTRRPAPLHLAHVLDKSHPEYRAPE